MTEKVIFTHDDRSVRPIILVKTEGAIISPTKIEHVIIALFDFKKMKCSDTNMGKRVL